MISPPMLNQQSPCLYVNGEQHVSGQKLDSNVTGILDYGNKIGQTLHEIDSRIVNLENMITWIKDAHPEVIAGYWAVKDVERSVNS